MTPVPVKLVKMPLCGLKNCMNVDEEIAGIIVFVPEKTPEGIGFI